MLKDTLVFDVRTIRDVDFSDYEVEVKASLLELDFDDVNFNSPVHGTVHLLRHGENNIYVKAEVSTDIELQCGRCLEHYKDNIAATFEMQFTPSTNPEEVAAADDDEEHYYDGETFDISENARQALVIQIPGWPLCSQVCVGLCLSCGENLNSEQCTCPETEDVEPHTPKTNSPFAELQELLDTAKVKNKTEPKNRKENTLKNGTS